MQVFTDLTNTDNRTTDIIAHDRHEQTNVALLAKFSNVLFHLCHTLSVRLSVIGEERELPVKVSTGNSNLMDGIITKC